jgi:hypothetical protein
MDSIILDTESLSRTGYFICHLFNVKLLFKTQGVTKLFTHSREKSLLVECHPLDANVRGGVTADVYVAWVLKRT